MKALSKILLPFLATSFCFALTSCTDKSSEETPIVGDTVVTLSTINVKVYFDIEVKKEADNDDSSNEYKYHVVIVANRHVKNINYFNFSFKTKFNYRIRVDDKDVNKSQEFYFETGRFREFMYKTEINVITFEQPYDQLLRFEQSVTFTSAEGVITRKD